MPSTTVNGIDLYYEETGSGPPLLLIAGLSGTSQGWEVLQPAMSERFRVIAFDNRGAGRSSAPTGPYTTRQMADDAAALLDHLGIERAHVIGHSMGGMIAQELALAHPERVDRLVLLGTAARLHPLISGPWLNTWVQAVEPGTDPRDVVLFLMPWFFTPAFMAHHDQVEAALAEWLSDPYPAPAHGVAAQAAASRAHDTLDRLPRIAAPTLVLVGAEDIVTPVTCSRELAAGIPGACLQVLERCGHIPDAEYPEAVSDALLAFLVA
jgi:3-oxoadipate enol-lactonase